MSQGTGIEWTDCTWNVVVGCTPVSPGCLNCYAATMARRLEAMGRPEYAPREREATPRELRDIHAAVGGGKLHDHERMVEIRIAEVKGGRAVFTGEVRCLEERLLEPLHWRKPRRVFVCSMADLFHEAVPFEFIDRVFAVMALCPQHTFQVLTKRPERMAAWFLTRDTVGAVYQEWIELCDNPAIKMQEGACEDWWNKHERGLAAAWPLRNVWLGASVEDQERLRRAWELLDCPAAVRFLSCEPLLGPVDLNALELLCRSWRRGATLGTYLDWVIVGGESGAHARPCDLAWVRSIVQQCQGAEVPVFVKQLGAKPVCGCGSDVGAWARNHGERRAECARCGMVLPLRNRKGGDPAEWPEDLRVRAMPVRDER